MKIRHWEKFQHYKKRHPPWIRLYADLINKREFGCLSGDAVKTLVQLWILASEADSLDGVLPDTEDIAYRLRLDSKVLASHLSELHQWVTADASELLATCKQSATSESESESDQITSEAETECPTSGEAGPAAPAKVFSDQTIEMANLLGQLMVDNDPKAKLPQTETQQFQWLDAIDKINRLDERPWPEIETVIRWCQADDFWRSNILSPAKLRKQFPKLLLATKRGNGKQTVTDFNKETLRKVRAAREARDEAV